MRRPVLGVTLLAGCVAAGPLDLPPEAASARSAIVAIESEGSPLVYAVDLETGTFPPITVGRAQLYLFLYSDSLASLGIPVGPIPKLADSEDGRPLPSGSIFVAKLPETAWAAMEREALPESIARFRLPDLLIGECERSRGCFRVLNEDEFCQLPCVEPSEAEPQPPAPAQPPEAPSMLPCRGGWSASGARCAPIAMRCPSVQWLGDAACSTAGASCPAGDYSEDLPPGVQVLVSASGSIQQAIDGAADGAVIAVAKGRFVESLRVNKRVAIVGACAETVIAAPIDVQADASLVSMQVAPGGGAVAITVAAGAMAVLTDVVVWSAAIGLEVLGSVQGERVAVSADRGIEIAGSAMLDRVVVRAAAIEGVAVGGSADLTNLRVSSSGTGVLAYDQAQVSLSSVHLVGNVRGAAAVGSAVVEIDDGLLARSSEVALLVQDSASLTARKVQLIDHGRGLIASGGTARIEDGFVERSNVHSLVTSNGPASVTLARADLTEARYFGVYATAGTVVLNDVAIHDNGDTAGGEGIVVDGAATIEAHHLSIERVLDYGIRVLSTDTKAELRLDDLTLRDIAGEGIEMGRTYAPAATSMLTIHRMLAERVSEYAVDTVSGSANEITDATVRDGDAGGISSVGGVLTLTRAELTGIRGPSLDVTSGEMSLSDLVIRDPENGLVTEGWIMTDVSAIDSAMTVDRFSISGASGAGILVRQFSRMKLIAGRILDNEVGVEVRADGFIYSSLEGDVIYRGNRMHNLLKLGQMPE